MTLTAAIGLLGVLLGSLITAFLTVYQEWVTTRREREEQRKVFQRDSVLALQGVLTELELAVYREQDRMVTEMKSVGSWPARQWETPTAEAWQDTFIRAEALRARLFDDKLCGWASEIGKVSHSSIWSASLEDAQHANKKLRRLSARFNQRVREVLQELL
jgi:hypothetical protein